MSKHPRRALPWLLTVVPLVLAGQAAQAEEGNIFTNIFKYGGTTVPPSQAAPLDEPYCPTVDVPEGGAALRNPPNASGTALRSQTTLGRLARECTRLQDGGIRVKVGIEGHVLLGPAGAPGRFEAPLAVSLKAAGKVIATRSRRVAVAVPSGAAQGLFSVIEDDLIVPAASAGNYDIEVRLGGSAPHHAPGRRKPAVPLATSEAPVAAPATEE
ncbi:hypothetical protein [Methylobacterium gossipiicola]|uniref:Uncharacterized protein n=1 Tax=Methylobacterium gossipiicola TaxID=582675 RepID=A0A1I2VDC2_9HYPH|nr:hypothetical protein [Methylobacterium gossipiicola]SFG87355.1 hypothetical protein SAMN05192565_11491 [Methylobacterium gossipiicola]